MLTTFVVAIAQNVILGWLWRRLQELVAFIATLAPFFLALPPEHQQFLWEVLQGRGGGLSISAYIGFGYYLFTQWQSWRATVRPQVVTAHAKKIALPKSGEGASTTRKVEVLAEGAPQRRTLWEMLTGG